MNGIPARTVLVLGGILEGTLFIISVFWAWLRGISLLEHLTWPSAGMLIVPLALLLLANYLLFFVLPSYLKALSELHLFREEVVLPLASNLSLLGICFIAAASGIGEELLFRGIIFTEVQRICGTFPAVFFSGVLFAWVHFLGAVKRFPLTFLIYCVVGIGLSALFALSGSLTLLILLHAFYNFFALTYLRYGASPTIVPN